MERDDPITITVDMGENFNSHAHVERDAILRLLQLPLVYFNSHAHVERDPKKPLSSDGKIISTHTLTWSVTLSAMYCAKKNLHFNSHAHVERD